MTDPSTASNYTPAQQETALIPPANVIEDVSDITLYADLSGTRRTSCICRSRRIRWPSRAKRPWSCRKAWNRLMSRSVPLANGVHLRSPRNWTQKRWLPSSTGGG